VAALRTRFAGARAVWGLMEAKALAALERLCPGAEVGSAEVEAGIVVVCTMLLEEYQKGGHGSGAPVLQKYLTLRLFYLVCEFWPDSL
jgi:hypothetical protein